MSHSQFHRTRAVLRHAWLNLWDKHMTTGRINQISIYRVSVRKRIQTHTHTLSTLSSTKPSQLSVALCHWCSNIQQCSIFFEFAISELWHSPQNVIVKTTVLENVLLITKWDWCANTPGSIAIKNYAQARLTRTLANTRVSPHKFFLVMRVAGLHYDL